MRRALLVWAASLLAVATGAWAADYYVTPTGSTGNIVFNNTIVNRAGGSRFRA